MRHSMRALVSAMIVGCLCCATTAAETGSRFWSFGKKEEIKIAPPVEQPEVAITPTPAPQPQPTVANYPPAAPPDITPESEEERSWMVDSPLAKVSWPRLSMPKSPFVEKEEAAPNRNAWVETPPAPPRRSPMQVVKDGSRSFGESTKKAWTKTKDALTPGEPAPEPSSRIARGNKKSFWKRMMFDEPQEQQPQTVTEWMAQDRLVP